MKTINCGPFEIVKRQSKWFVKLYGNFHIKPFRSLDDAYYWARHERDKLTRRTSQVLPPLSNEEVDAWTRHFATSHSLSAAG